MEKTRQYQKCPNCDRESLTELTHELARQSGVRLTTDGNLDYDLSEVIQMEGNAVKVVGYKCDNCNSRLIICNGKLTDAPDERDEHTIGACLKLERKVTSTAFDALPWFATAGDDKILALARSGFAHDYPSDEVAMEMAGHLPQLEAQFSQLEAIGGGYYCVINALEAMTWIRENRPHLYEELADDEDIPFETEDAVRRLTAQKGTPIGKEK